MKTRIAYQHEFTRHGVTPAQFLAYIRQQQKKHPGEIAYDCDLRMFAAEGWCFNYSDALPSEKPCAAERGTDKPYEKQTYIRNFDGSTYNEIVEFDFDDEKTGHGYYYTVQIDVADEDREANTAEQVAAIIRRRAEQADRQEADAAKLEAEADKAEREGYTAKWWIDARRTEAARKRREAEQTRAAIKATQEVHEAPETAPAAEAEQQPTETENAPQAATQAAEGTDEKKEAETMTTTEREALERINARQNAANLFTNIGPEDIAAELATMEAEQAAPAPDPDAATLAPADAAQVWTEEGETVATATEAATVAGIIRRKGGYRERDLLKAPHTMTHGETWNAEHKVVYVTETTPDPDGYCAGCAVDIVTRSIVG